MTNIVSLGLRVFPGRARLTWALTWRTQRGNQNHEHRLAYGVLEGYSTPLHLGQAPDVLRAIAAQIDREAGRAPPDEVGPGAPGGGGGVPPRGPAIDHRPPSR